MGGGGWGGVGWGGGGLAGVAGSREERRAERTQKSLALADDPWPGTKSKGEIRNARSSYAVRSTQPVLLPLK